MHSDSGKVDEAAHVQATGQAHDQGTVTDVAQTTAATAASDTATLGEGATVQKSPAGPIKLTVLYGHPTDPAAFERYYAGTHMPLVRKIQGVRTEQAKVIGSPDG